MIPPLRRKKPYRIACTILFYSYKIIYIYSFNSYLQMPPWSLYFIPGGAGVGTGEVPAPASFKVRALTKVGLRSAAKECVCSPDFIRVIPGQARVPCRPVFPYQRLPRWHLESQMSPTGMFGDNVF